MRITADNSYRNLLRDIQRISERMQASQGQISSGKKLTRPSDDPSAVSDVVRISAERSEIARYIENAETGFSRLDYLDTVFDGLEQLTERVRNLALLSKGNLANAGQYAAEIEGLRDHLLATTNTTFQGQYIFGGSETTSPPFVEDSGGNVSYAGNSDTVGLQIGRAATLQTKIPGDDVFQGSVDIFSTLNDLLDSINNGDSAGITAQTVKLEEFFGVLSANRGRVGGLINVAKTVESELKQSDLVRTGELSRLQDADLSQALTEFTQNETALRAATAVGARISNISILDYLR